MSSFTIQELPEGDRPREKLARLGPGALSDAELIAILLRVGMKGVNAVELARQILVKCGSLAALARSSVAEISKIKGSRIFQRLKVCCSIRRGQVCKIFSCP